MHASQSKLSVGASLPWVPPNEVSGRAKPSRDGESSSRRG